MSSQAEHPNPSPSPTTDRIDLAENEKYALNDAAAKIGQAQEVANALVTSILAARGYPAEAANGARYEGGTLIVPMPEKAP